ncbi:15422_t:CDS:2, partial [Acaulospora morrowiae]
NKRKSQRTNPLKRKEKKPMVFFENNNENEQNEQGTNMEQEKPNEMFTFPNKEEFQMTSYSIVSDLQNKPVNIIFGQLLKEVPSMKQELLKSLIKKKTVRRKTKMNVNIGTSQESTALYCTATVYEHKIPLIIDSGSSGSVVTMQLLKKLKVKPERSSIIKIISVHGESKRALSEISNFPFNVGGNEIPVDVVVTDANSYQALVGNDWLSKVNDEEQFKYTTNSMEHYMLLNSDKKENNKNIEL